MNYKVKIDLAKLNKVAAVNLTDKSGKQVKCVVIPIEKNDIFVSEKGGIYLDLSAVAMKKGRYGQSHLLKRSIPSEIYKAMTDEEKKNQPIIGSLNPIRPKQAEVTKQAQVAIDEEDDLPF